MITLSQKQRDELEGMYDIDEKCSKCGGDMYWWNGGDQGGVPGKFCKNCNYEERGLLYE